VKSRTIFENKIGQITSYFEVQILVRSWSTLSDEITVTRNTAQHKFERLHFPVKLRFAWRINKAQGQSLKAVDIVFKTGGSAEGLHMYTTSDHRKNSKCCL
jgi:hypothetical protein